MLVNLVPAIYSPHAYLYSNENGDGFKVMLLVEVLKQQDSGQSNGFTSS